MTAFEQVQRLRDMRDTLNSAANSGITLDNINGIIANAELCKLWLTAKAKWEDEQEAARILAEANAVVPEGWRCVGWYCEHRQLPDYKRTPHKERSTNNKRGWTVSTSTMSSFTHASEYRDMTPLCELSRPVYVRTDQSVG